MYIAGSVKEFVRIASLALHLLLFSCSNPSDMFHCNPISLHYLYHLQTKLREGNVFTPVCQSFCLWGACMMKGVCMVKGQCVWPRGGVHGEGGVCMAKGGHTWQRGHFWQGA